MNSQPPSQAVLLTGVYGSGKSSVAAEMADILEKRGERFAYIDLDFLAWGWTGTDDHAERRMVMKNLAPIVANFLEVGVRYFVLAGFIGTRGVLERLRTTLAMAMRTVRLTVPFDEIERRLGSDVTAGRQEDLRHAAEQIAGSEGEGLEDLLVENQGPIRQVAIGILRWLEWV